RAEARLHGGRLRAVRAARRARRDGDLFREALRGIGAKAQHHSELPRSANDHPVMFTANAKFLIVEDSPTMRRLISFSLQTFRNAKIIESVDGLDALRSEEHTSELQ